MVHADALGLLVLRRIDRLHAHLDASRHKLRELNVDDAVALARVAVEIGQRDEHADHEPGGDVHQSSAGVFLPRPLPLPRSRLGRSRSPPSSMEPNFVSNRSSISSANPSATSAMSSMRSSVSPSKSAGTS